MESLEIFESFDCECCGEVALIVLEKLFDGDFGFYIIVGIKILGVILDLSSFFGQLTICGSYWCDLYDYGEECLCEDLACETAGYILAYLGFQRILALIIVFGYTKCCSDCCPDSYCDWCQTAKEKELDDINNEIKQNQTKTRAPTTSNAALPSETQDETQDKTQTDNQTVTANNSDNKDTKDDNNNGENINNSDETGDTTNNNNNGDEKNEPVEVTVANTNATQEDNKSVETAEKSSNDDDNDNNNNDNIYNSTRPEAKSFGSKLMLDCKEKTISLCTDKCGENCGKCCNYCFKYTNKTLNCIFRKQDNPSVKSNLLYGSKWNGMDAFCKVYSAAYQDNFKNDWKLILWFVLFFIADLSLNFAMIEGSEVTFFVFYVFLQGFIGQVEWIMVLFLIPAKKAETNIILKKISAYILLLGLLFLICWAYYEVLRSTSLFNYENDQTERCTEWVEGENCDYTYYGIYWTGIPYNSSNFSVELCPGVYDVGSEYGRD